MNRRQSLAALAALVVRRTFRGLGWAAVRRRRVSGGLTVADINRALKEHYSGAMGKLLLEDRPSPFLVVRSG